MYLGYILKGGQRWLSEACKETVLKIPTPKNVRQVREFLGTAGFLLPMDCKRLVAYHRWEEDPAQKYGIKNAPKGRPSTNMGVKIMQGLLCHSVILVRELKQLAKGIVSEAQDQTHIGK